MCCRDRDSLDKPGAGLDPAPVGGVRFVDVSATRAGAIDAIAEAGITLGSTSDLCRPTEPCRAVRWPHFSNRAAGL
jgi:hypothetical protein